MSITKFISACLYLKFIQLIHQTKESPNIIPLFSLLRGNNGVHAEGLMHAKRLPSRHIPQPVMCFSSRMHFTYNVENTNSDRWLFPNWKLSQSLNSLSYRGIQCTLTQDLKKMKFSLRTRSTMGDTNPRLVDLDCVREEVELEPGSKPVSSNPLALCQVCIVLGSLLDFSQW